MTNEYHRQWRKENAEHYRDYQREYRRAYRARKKQEQQELKKIESTKTLEEGLEKYVKTYEDLQSTPKAKR